MTVSHLSLENLRKAFGAKDVLNDVSLDVEEGELLAILGPSGCGKSTVLRVVAGLLRADRGTVRIAGREMDSVPPRDRGIGFVFQDYALFPKVTVRDNIAFGLRVRGVSAGDRNRKTTEMLNLVGLAEEADRAVETLSGGQRQRVALARAILSDPRILILDEATNQLDVEAEALVHESLHDFLRARTTILVTHRLSTLMLADRVVVMRAGRIIEDKPSSALGRKWESFAELLSKAA